jgi:hypothetical protein
MIAYGGLSVDEAKDVNSSKAEKNCGKIKKALFSRGAAKITENVTSEKA